MIKNYYLVDFENVNTNGLKGADELSSEDHIIIFYTKNAPKLSLKDITKINTTIEFREVSSGKQSADIHISSYLGYLAGEKVSDHLRRVIIISRDADFDNVIDFWNCNKDIANFGTERFDSIFDSINRKSQVSNSCENSQEFETTDQVEKTLDAELTKSDVIKESKFDISNIEQEIAKLQTDSIVTSEVKSLLNQIVLKSLHSSGFETTTTGKVASTLVKLVGSDDFKKKSKSELCKLPQGNEIYKLVKPILVKFEKFKNPIKQTPIQQNVTTQKSTKKQLSKIKGDLNTDVMKIVRSGGYDGQKPNSVASILVKKYEKGKSLADAKLLLKQNFNDGDAIYEVALPILKKYYSETVQNRANLTSKDKTQITPEIKKEFSIKIMRCVSSSGFKSDILPGKVTSLIMKVFGKGNLLSDAQNSLKGKFENSEKIIVALEPLLKEYSCFHK